MLTGKRYTKLYTQRYVLCTDRTETQSKSSSIHNMSPTPHTSLLQKMFASIVVFPYLFVKSSFHGNETVEISIVSN